MKTYHRLLRLLIALNGVDAGTTIAMVRTGMARELNPVMRACLNVSPFFFLLVKLALIEVLVSMLFAKGDRRIARVGMWIITTAYLLLVLGQVGAICLLYP